MFFLAVDSASIFIVLLTIFKNSTSILVGIVLTTNKTGNKIHSSNKDGRYVLISSWVNWFHYSVLPCTLGIC
eukprot:m.256994 g.256994  ORF g.256994 m.256994 type:complete len:72 (+) comp40404_c0_seq89:776-991(+)